MNLKVVIACFCSLIQLCVCTVGAEISPQAIAAKLRAQVNRINTLDLTITQDSRSYSRQAQSSESGVPASYRHVNRCRISGNMFRYEGNLPGTQIDPAYQFGMTDSIAAYNGTVYQVFDKKDLLLGLSRTPAIGYAGSFPLFRAFLGLIPLSSEETLDTLRSEKTWESWERSARYLRVEQFLGHNCVVFACKPDWATLTHNVTFAVDCDYFPVRTEVLDTENRVIEETRTTELKNYANQGEPIYIPLTMTLTATDSVGKVLDVRTYAIDKSSAAINRDIDSTIFTLPRAMATHVSDQLSGPAPRRAPMTEVASTLPVAEVIQASKPSDLSPISRVSKFTQIVACCGLLLIVIGIAIFTLGRSRKGQ